MATPTTKATAALTGPTDAWTPIRGALRDGSRAPTVVVTDPAEADALVVGLRRACERKPWLARLAAADAHRLLRAAGITMLGSGRQRFDNRGAAEAWGQRPDEFESAAMNPARGFGARPDAPALAPAGLVASSLNYVTRPDRLPWATGSAVGRIEALTASVLTPTPSAAGAYTFEAWWFLFIRCDLVIDRIDELDARGRVTATSYSRWSIDDGWERTDEFCGVFTRDGASVTESNDAGRAVMLDAVITAYLAHESPRRTK